MKLYIMKREALETLKANLPVVYGKYYTEKTNQWISDICGEDPFIEFKDVTEFKLADLNSDLTPGEIDLNNCKILYEKLQFLSESQASDERLWQVWLIPHFTIICVSGGGMDTGKSRRALKKKRVLSRPDFFTDILEGVDFTEIRYQNAGG